MSDCAERLRQNVEPLLLREDPRSAISAYHDMPCAIFRYPAEEELRMRKEIRLLGTRLEQAGKRVAEISLAGRLQAAVLAETDLKALSEAERSLGTKAAVETVHEILHQYRPLVDLVAERLPSDPDPLCDIVFLTRAASLFPFYRTSSLLEQLKGRVNVPTILFFPGDLDGAAGLRFMGLLDADHNYRPMIF